MVMSTRSYLAILKSSTPEDHPWMDLPGTEEVGAAFANMANAVAVFVEAMQESDDLSYGEAIQTLEDLVHAFPETDGDSLLDVLLAFMEG